MNLAWTRRGWLAASAILAATPAFARSARPLSFADRIAGAVCGMAIGDGMGAPVEGWTPQRIAERFAGHDFLTFLPATHSARPGQGPGKGDGRITDDTLLLEALMRVYAAHADHLDAYAYARLMVAEVERAVFVPERGDVRPALERPLWHPERHMHARLTVHEVSPREAGLGNWPNQGLGDVVMPVGAVNAGDPDAAYAEAVAFGVAHQTAQGLESAALSAAAFAAAFAAGASIEGVIAACRRLAKDATGEALKAVLDATNPDDPLTQFIAKTRAAYLPFSGFPGGREPPPGTKFPSTEASRKLAVENGPIALACLVYGRGEALATLRAAVMYGQDCESIAARALGMVGAMKGLAALPSSLVEASADVNRRDFAGQGRAFAIVAQAVLDKDRARLRAREAALSVR